MLALIDYGIGNLRSVASSLEAAGVTHVRTGDPARIADASRLLLPGVGAFGACALALRAAGLDRVVMDRVAAGVPLLGVCVGMQLLFDSSEERGTHAGLGLLPGRVVAFEPQPGRKVPHMGWNVVEGVRDHPVVAPDPTWAYFVHTYHAVAAEASDVLATASYPSPFPAIVGRENVVGVQYHPEKSSRAGLDLLRRFASWTPTPVSPIAA